MLKKEKKDSLLHDEQSGWKEYLLDAIFGLVDISLEDKKNMKIAPMNNDPEAGSISNSKLLGIDNADDANEEIDEDFAFVDEDIWQRLVNTWTLEFKSPKREEMYFRTNLLPLRILLTRLYSSILVIILLINLKIISTSSLASTIWVISLILGLIFVFLTWAEKGKYYVDICLESKWSRFALFGLEVPLFYRFNLLRCLYLLSLHYSILFLEDLSKQLQGLV